ncbi:MAG: hypothetical protein ACOCUS_02690, partial [Polyangiales bacterium]
DLPSLMADRPHFYGDLASRGWDGVAFAWTFTTQSVTRDLDTLRDGLYARGPFERLSEQYPAAMAPLPMKGGSPRDPCDASETPYVADGDAFREALSSVVGPAFDLEGEAAEEAIAQYDNLGHVSVALFETPYLLGDPDQESLTEAWDIDSTTGKGRLGREVIPALIFVPEETDEHEQPFPVAFFSHGHGSSAAEVLLFAGSMVKQGTAVVALNAQGHGVELDPALVRLLRPSFESNCIGPALDGLVSGRARDLDADEDVDSGAHFWTAYVFHIRDVVRQTALDYMQAIRIVRSFDGETEAAPVRFDEPPSPLEEAVEFDGDTTGDGEPNLAGDFDGNGVPDIGGPDVRYSFMGGSLGGIMTNLMMGVEPALRSGVPVVGAGGLSDVGSRTTNGAVRPAMILRLLGPLVVSTPSEGPSESSACEAGERSVRFIVPWLTDARHNELACMREDALVEGDAVIVRNVRSGEAGCAGVTSEGRFRTSVATNTGDSLQIEIYRDASGQLDYGSCTWRGEPQEPVDVIDTWRSGNGEGEARCARCAKYMGRTWEPGDPLVAPTEGMGEQRQTPDFRRLMHLAQVALEPADPINYARRVFLKPVTAPDVEPQPRSVLVMNTIGDPNVSIATGNAYARAAGILPSLPPDAPDELAQWRTPAAPSRAATTPRTATPPPRRARSRRRTTCSRRATCSRASRASAATRGSRPIPTCRRPPTSCSTPTTSTKARSVSPGTAASSRRATSPMRRRRCRPRCGGCGRAARPPREATPSGTPRPAASKACRRCSTPWSCPRASTASAASTRPSPSTRPSTCSTSRRATWRPAAATCTITPRRTSTCAWPSRAAGFSTSRSAGCPPRESGGPRAPCRDG